MAYKFSIKSKPGLSFEKEKRQRMKDYFNGGNDDNICIDEDTICLHMIDFDENTGTVIFDGEWGEEDDDSLEGSRPDITVIQNRLYNFAQWYDLEWEEGSIIIDDSNDNKLFMKNNVCTICGEEGIDDEHDLYDCAENWEEENGIPRGTWILNWVRKMQEAKKNEEPYQSDFSKWSQSIKKDDKK